MKPKKLLLGVLSAAMVGVLAVGCGGGGAASGGSEGGGSLTLGNIGWDENIALSNLTKVLLEEEFDYDEVELITLDVGPLYQGVGTGDLDAFQDVWMPNHTDYMAQVGDDVEELDSWYEGVTQYGIAVPDYMEDVRSIADLNDAGVGELTGIESGSAFHQQINEFVIPEYDLDLELAPSSTPAMLAELGRAYNNEDPMVFLAWSPHWMNAEYDFHYLEDPMEATGEFSDPSQLSTIVRADLQEDDPVAYAFLDAVTMDEDEMNELQAEIQDAGDEIEGVNNWLEANRDVVDPWVQETQQAQES